MPKILIVEDEATVRDTLALNLRAEGYDVATASDGEAGLAAARSGKPDLVVLDVMLPRLDGLTVCRLLRRESTLPIILLTARGTETDKIIGLETGADDYIVKPFALGEFLARVRAALRRGQVGPDCLGSLSPGTCGWTFKGGAPSWRRGRSPSRRANSTCWLS
jgi:DNA-binding response OmpR family regulator